MKKNDPENRPQGMPGDVARRANAMGRDHLVNSASHSPRFSGRLLPDFRHV
jgi:hypothetical protein